MLSEATSMTGASRKKSFIASFLDVDDFHADTLAVWVDIRLGGRYAHRTHLGMRQHRARDVVAQRFLQMNMALRNAPGDGLAHEIVIDHFMEMIPFRGRDSKRNEKIDIDQHALLAFLFEFMD